MNDKGLNIIAYLLMQKKFKPDWIGFNLSANVYNCINSSNVANDAIVKMIKGD